MAAINGHGEPTTHVYQGGEDGELAPTPANSSEDASVLCCCRPQSLLEICLYLSTDDEGLTPDASMNTSLMEIMW